MEAAIGGHTATVELYNLSYVNHDERPLLTIAAGTGNDYRT